MVVTDLREKEGSEVVAQIKAVGGRAEFIKHDVGSEQDWVRVIDHTKRTYDRLDVVVNNAGIGMTGTIESTTLEDWRKLMCVNLDGVFLGTPDIEQDAVGSRARERGDAGLNGRSEDLVPLVLQRRLDVAAVVCVVVDDQDRGTRHQRLATRPRV